MRIREIVFNNFRSFRGERRISFVDPDTDMVRPVTVLTGSNGSGKTTVLEAIEELLKYMYNPMQKSTLVREALESGLIDMTVELMPEEIGESASIFPTLRLHIAVGKYEPASTELQQGSGSIIRRLKTSEPLGEIDNDIGLTIALRIRADQQQSETNVYGGWLYFPHDRRLSYTRGGPIESPDDKQEWLFRFSAEDQWRGSLEQLWVWQNYLDLEQHSKHNQATPSLPTFIESVEKVLGEKRRIFVEEGRVRVTTPYAVDGKETSVRLDQLPSGEQQVLLLFGELARRRRQGCVLAIDEIENSLHPTLQRLVMWNLNRLAREWDSQVIVSTHSLEVINTVRGGAFINLDYPEDRFNLSLPETDASQA